MSSLSIVFYKMFILKQVMSIFILYVGNILITRFKIIKYKIQREITDNYVIMFNLIIR